MSIFARNFGERVFKIVRIFGNDLRKYTPFSEINAVNRNNVTTLNLRYNPLRNYQSSITSYKVTHSEQNDFFLKSSSLFLSAGILSFFGLEKDDEKESELITTIKRGVLLTQKEEFKKAEQMFHLALKLAQEQQNYDGITFIYDMLANLAYDQEEYQKAEKLFVSVIQRLLSTGVSTTDNKVIHISLKLANIYKIQKDFRKAEEGFKFCKNHLQASVESGKKDEDTVLLWAMALDGYARFLVDAARLPEAFICFQKAYDLCVEINGEENEEIVVLLNDLGTICFIQNDLDKAVSFLKQAIAIGNKLPDMKDFSSVLLNLGTVYMKKGMVEEAKQFYEAAWKNAKRHKNSGVLKEVSSCMDELHHTKTG
ncbi:hypothetical protein ANN_11086 [Periplaneta americana]|uniref:Uncharacterized protein n=1 Tax=Periplaneta americana TaxID=6978 RepID=A0ABQ8T419_PERAM|nr:hypothetical protein ANN_11086 [Periplaneta americana]